MIITADEAAVIIMHNELSSVSSGMIPAITILQQTVFLCDINRSDDVII